MTERELGETILSYMREHYTLSLATHGADGVWATSVFYANDGLDIYFLSELKTQHSRNIASNPIVAATVNEDYHDWRQIKGIQLEGKAAVLTGRKEISHAFAIYSAKFPFVTSFLASPKDLARMIISGKVLSIKFHKIVPTKLFFLDNEKGFSKREELVL